MITRLFEINSVLYHYTEKTKKVPAEYAYSYIKAGYHRQNIDITTIRSAHARIGKNEHKEEQHTWPVNGNPGKSVIQEGPIGL